MAIDNTILSYTYPASGTVPGQGRKIETIYAHSDSNTELSVSTVAGRLRRLLKVVVKFSEAVTRNIEVSTVCGAGAVFDHSVRTLSLTADSTACYRPVEDVWCHPGDTFKVVVPAAGVGVTSYLVLETEMF